jgi:hypothetical protein
MSQGSIGNFFNNGAFDPDSVETAKDFDVLPAGDYPVVVESAEVKPTKKGTGHYLGVQLVVVDGPAKGRKLFDNFNLQNPSEKAVQIGLEHLSSLCKATIGSVPFADESQLLQQSCIACVKVKDNDNAIRAYKPFADALSVQPQPPAQRPVMQAPAPTQAPMAPVAAAPVQQQPVPSGERPSFATALPQQQQQQQQQQQPIQQEACQQGPAFPQQQQQQVQPVQQQVQPVQQSVAAVQAIQPVQQQQAQGKLPWESK